MLKLRETFFSFHFFMQTDLQQQYKIASAEKQTGFRKMPSLIVAVKVEPVSDTLYNSAQPYTIQRIFDQTDSSRRTTIHEQRQPTSSHHRASSF